MTDTPTIIKEVIKVQRPLVTNDSTRPWLLYNRDRSRELMVPAKCLPPHIPREMGSDPKAFFDAEWSEETNCWAIEKRLHPVREALQRW